MKEKQEKEYEKYKKTFEIDSAEFLSSFEGKSEITLKSVIILNRWVEFCYENKINFFNFVANNTRIDIRMLMFYLRENGDEYSQTFENDYMHIVSIYLARLINTIIEVVSSIDKDFVFQKKFIQKFQQEALDNTYDLVIDSIEDNIIGVINKLPLNDIHIQEKTIEKIINDIEYEKNIHNDLFVNSKKFTKLNEHNHYFHKLPLSNIEVDFKNGKAYFIDLANGLLKGYSSKGVLLSVDKASTIRLLKTKIKHLQDFNNQESDILIQICNTLITFIESKKYSNMIPFKSVAKELNITKNEAKNYAKKILTSLNDKTFLNNYEKFYFLN
jgi:hypothetical protein